jgi:hypothetical protein
MKPLLASLLLLTALRADAQDVKPQSSTTELDSFNKALAWLPQFIASAFDHDNLPGIIRGDQINLHIRSGETQGYVGKRKPPFWFIFHITKDHDSSQSVFSYLARQETAQAPWIIRSAWRTDKQGLRHLYPATPPQPSSKTTATSSPAKTTPAPTFNLGSLKTKPGSTTAMPGAHEAWQRLKEMQYKGTAPGLLPEDEITAAYNTAAIHPDFSASKTPPYIPFTLTKNSNGTFLQYLFVRNATGSWKLGSAWTVSSAGILTDLKVTRQQELIITNNHEFTAPYQTELFALFAVNAGMSGPPDQAWFEIKPDGTGGLDYSSADLLKLYQKLPPHRKQKGIIIFGSLTHLQDLKKARSNMTPFQWKCYQDPGWLKAKKAFVEELVQACDKAKIPLWINIVLGGQDIPYTRLSPRP